MKEYLAAHAYITTPTKGIFGTTLGLVLFQMADLTPIYQIIASVIGAFVLVFTAINCFYDFRHKQRRDAKEKKSGYQADRTSAKDESDE